MLSDQYTIDTLQDLNEPQLNIRTQLAKEEIDAAILFLRRRFPHMYIHKSVSCLDAYNKQKQEGRPVRPMSSSSIERRLTNQPVSRANRWMLNQKEIESKEEKKLREKENLRLVAQLFCEKGEDYDYAKIFIPELERTNYRNMLLSIANTTIKELMNFLKKDCRVELKELTQPQKISIKTMLMSAHTWMGVKSIEALETFFKFISRKYTERYKMITKAQAINLFSTIAKRLNDSSLDLTFLERGNNEFGEEMPKYRPSNIQRLPEVDKGPQTIIAQAFLDIPDPLKISYILIQRYGLKKFWYPENVKAAISQILVGGLTKLQSIRRRGPPNQRKMKISKTLIETIKAPQYRALQHGITQLFLDRMHEKQIIYSLTEQILQLSDKISQTEAFRRRGDDSEENNQSSFIDDEEWEETHIREDEILNPRLSHSDREPVTDFSEDWGEFDQEGFSRIPPQMNSDIIFFDEEE